MYTKRQSEVLGRRFPLAGRDSLANLVLEDRETFDCLRDFLKACVEQNPFEKQVGMTDGKKNVASLVRLAEESGVERISYSSDGQTVDFAGPQRIQHLRVVIG